MATASTVATPVTSLSGVAFQAPADEFIDWDDAGEFQVSSLLTIGATVASALLLAGSAQGGQIENSIYSESDPSIEVRVLSRDAEGEPASGVAIISGVPDSGGVVGPDKVVNVGGGTWDYGSSTGLNGTKDCWSNYNHPTNAHSATSIIGSQNDFQRKTPKVWAKTSARGGILEKCHAFVVVPKCASSRWPGS